MRSLFTDFHPLNRWGGFWTVRFPVPRFVPRFIARFVSSSFRSAFQLRKLVSCGEDVEPGALDLGFSGWIDDQHIGVGGKAGEDEVETGGFDDEFTELVR